VTRRRFVQSTTLLGTRWVSTNKIITSAPAQAQEAAAEIKLAQTTAAAPIRGRTADLSTGQDAKR